MELRGYSEKHIEEAVRECGPALTRCESYIAQLQSGMSIDDFNDEAVSEEAWARGVMHDIGFSEDAIATALKVTSNNAPKALQLLLYGDVNAGTSRREMQRHISVAC